MNKNLLNEYPAQAIECKLHFDKLDENCQYNWPCETYSKLCKELKGENSVGIHFIKRIIEKDAHKQVNRLIYKCYLHRRFKGAYFNNTYFLIYIEEDKMAGHH